MNNKIVKKKHFWFVEIFQINSRMFTVCIGVGIAKKDLEIL
jgi:hypothetical protein